MRGCPLSEVQVYKNVLSLHTRRVFFTQRCPLSVYCLWYMWITPLFSMEGMAELFWKRKKDRSNMYSGLISSTRSRFSAMLYVRRNALFSGSGRPCVGEERAVGPFMIGPGKQAIPGQHLSYPQGTTHTFVYNLSPHLYYVQGTNTEYIIEVVHRNKTQLCIYRILIQYLGEVEIT